MYVVSIKKTLFRRKRLVRAAARASPPPAPASFHHLSTRTCLGATLLPLVARDARTQSASTSVNRARPPTLRRRTAPWQKRRGGERDRGYIPTAGTFLAQQCRLPTTGRRRLLPHLRRLTKTVQQAVCRQPHVIAAGLPRTPIGGSQRAKASCGTFRRTATSTSAEGRTAAILSSADSDRPVVQQPPPLVPPQGERAITTGATSSPTASELIHRCLATVPRRSDCQRTGVSHASISCV